MRRKNMANDKKLVKAITSRDEDFAQWYTDVVREAKLCDYSSVKGCLNYLPNGYAIWERIQADLDARFKESGVENVYLPMMIPESLLQKEAIILKDLRQRWLGLLMEEWKNYKRDYAFVQLQRHYFVSYGQEQ